MEERVPDSNLTTGQRRKQTVIFDVDTRNSYKTRLEVKNVLDFPGRTPVAVWLGAGGKIRVLNKCLKVNLHN